MKSFEENADGVPSVVRNVSDNVDLRRRTLPRTKEGAFMSTVYRAGRRLRRDGGFMTQHLDQYGVAVGPKMYGDLTEIYDMGSR